MKNILVTGCGGDIGYSLGKIIASENIADKLVGCSIDTDNASIRYFGKIEKISPVTFATYLDELRAIVEKHDINLIIPMSEAELRFFSKEKIRFLNNVPILMANEEATEIGFDKYCTFKFLEKNAIVRPWTVLANENPIEFPCILKARAGSGSKSIVKIHTKNQLREHERLLTDKYILQEMLEPANEEYTCGVYRTKGGDIRTIVFRRELNGGQTGKGELRFVESIERLLYQIAEKLNLQGGINVQLRLTDQGPKIFELNPRFSSTVVFRHLLGFSDLIWSIQEYYNEKVDEFRLKSRKAKFFKVYDEFFLE